MNGVFVLSIEHQKTSSSLLRIAVVHPAELKQSKLLAISVETSDIAWIVHGLSHRAPQVLSKKDTSNPRSSMSKLSRLLEVGGKGSFRVVHLPYRM